MKIRKMLVPQSKWNIKATYSMTPEFIVVHNTYNDAPAVNEIAYMTRNNNWTSFHWAVDDVEAIQAIPHNRNAWAAGDGNGKGNRAGIQIEICYSKSGGPKFTKAEQNGAKLVAMILKQYGWDINKVKKHQDFMNKYCPHRTLDLGWDRFLKMVEKELKEETTGKFGKFQPKTTCPVLVKPNKTAKSVGAFVTKPFNVDDIIIGGKYLWAVTKDTGFIRYVCIADLDNWQGELK